MHARLMAPRMAAVVVACSIVLLAGCGTVRTNAVDLVAFTREPPVDPGVARVWARVPASPYPARLAVARVQSTEYSYQPVSNAGYPCRVVTVRDIETADAPERFAALPGVYDVVMLNGLGAPSELHTARELREAAGAVHADVLLVYTMDTSSNLDVMFPPLTFVTLGLFPNVVATSGSTGAVAVLDTRTGYVYDMSEATEKTNQLCNLWTGYAAERQSGARAERRAYKSMLEEIESRWGRVVGQLGKGTPTDPGATWNTLREPGEGAVRGALAPEGPVYETGG